MKEKILFIIPAYNEEANILQTVTKIWNYNKTHHTNYEVIVINDGSTDQTSEICRKNKIPHINLIHNLGIGGAVQTGYKYALEHDFDIALQYDGDGQHNVEYAKELFSPIINGRADVVIGSRFIDNRSTFKSTGLRRVGIRIISFLLRIFAHQKTTDPTSGFRAANKQAISFFANNYPKEYPEPEAIVMLKKKGLKIMEVPVEMNERIGGKSSIRAWKSVYYMISVSLSIIISSMKRTGV